MKARTDTSSRRRAGTTRVRGRPAGDARRRILDAAEELFADHGFDATSTARLARVAGVPKGLLFHYFPTKMEMLTALVAERTNVETIRESPVEPVGADVAATLRRLASTFHRAGTFSPQMRRILFREAETHPEVGNCFGRLYDEVVRHVRRAVDASLGDTRTASSSDRDALAQAFAAILLHEANLHGLTGRRVDVDAAAGLLAAGLATGLSAAG